jgi:alpha-beta hydrolase superfamily lysophospholipase
LLRARALEAIFADFENCRERSAVSKHHQSQLPRRALLKGAGAGLGLGVLSSAAPAAAAEEPIWSAEYWAQKGDVKLNLWRKRIGAPKAGETKPAVFLVHGSSNSARTSYDVTVPGKGEYSLMNLLARYGFDVWTMDHDGYGRSGSSGSSDIASGVEDLKAAMPIVLKQTGGAKTHFFGTSSGAIRAAAYAQAQPEHVDRLILSAFTYKGTAQPRSSAAARASSSFGPARGASATRT